MSKCRILIVDDDTGTAESTATLLGDKGFEVICVRTGSEAVAQLDLNPPDVALLELWLPGQDGLALLQQIRQGYPQVNVLMTSDHGSLETALQAIRLGAVDFLEKPHNPSRLLNLVQQVIEPGRVALADVRSQQSPVAVRLKTSALSPDSPHFTTEAPKQRTLAESMVLRGQGLQSGDKTAIQISPMPPGYGIRFRDITTGQIFPAAVKCVDSTTFCTSLRCETAIANTIEHLMSALHAYRLSNLLVTISNEIPIMDGSAVAFCQAIEATGIVEQAVEAECFVVEKRYSIGELTPETKYILVEPYNGFRVTYRVDYPAPIGVEEWTYEHHSGTSYHEAIAPARTFAFAEDVEQMHEAGLIPGGRMNNVILIGKSGIVNRSPMRFTNEFVRHKVLDIIGDLYLLGMPLRGHVRANLTGHTENVELVRTLQAAYAAA